MNIHRLLPAIIIAICIYCLAIPVDIMDVDAAQYASMAREMIDRGDYLNFFDRNQPYLDKPPFIFWISAAFINVFGVNNLAYKLPAILFAILGIFSVFRFARLWYDRETAILAAVILATTQGYFHFTNDVRTDVYLTNSVIAAIWLLSEQLKFPKSWYWIPAFFFVGIGMLAKGPLGLVAPALAIGTHILIKQDWKSLFKWQWIAGLVVVVLVLSPMLYGLYMQFDSHPETLVNKRTNVSGLRFFFWEQSFGRITGENVWKNDTGPFFFVHSFAWSFLPWALFFFAALIHMIKSGIKGSFNNFIKSKSEWISLGGVILPFMALSASKYKLPHYIYVVFPLAAVITSHYLIALYRNRQEYGFVWLRGLHVFVLFGAWAFVGIIFLWFFPLTNVLLMLVGFLGFAGFLYYAFSPKISYWNRLIGTSLISVLSVNVLMSAHFYPEVLEYQSGGKIGSYVHELGLDRDRLFNLNVGSRALDVYAQTVSDDILIEQVDSLLADNKAIYIYTDASGKESLELKGYHVIVLQQRDDFSVTLLRMNFGNPQKRQATLRPRYLLELK
jgi:4-amino-4-deoxy-L-arabinose transferase-like glycosyltransferase